MILFPRPGRRLTTALGLAVLFFAAPPRPAAAREAAWDGAGEQAQDLALAGRSAQARDEAAARAERAAAPGGTSLRGTWRPLTGGEIALAKKIFRDGIDYAAVRVYSGKWIPLQPDDVVMTPAGWIFYPVGYPDYAEDLSQGDQDMRHTFIHEMTHVWQHQQGINVIARRLSEGGKYDYLLAPDKTLDDYTLEQQADILADFYVITARGYDGNYFLPVLKRFLADPNSRREEFRPSPLDVAL